MPRLKTLLALLCVGLLLGTTGCPKDEKKEDKDEKSSKKKKGGDDDDDDDDKGKKKKKKGDDDDDDKADKKKKGDDDDKAGGDEIAKVGIKACDDYIEKLGKCIKKAPAAAKDGLKTAQTSSAKAWASGAKQEAAKDTIKKSCEEVLKTAKTAYKATCPGVFDDE